LIRFRYLLCLTALATSCGEREKKSSSAPAGEKATRTAQRPGREEGEEYPRIVLRGSYDEALASPDPAARERALEQVAWDGIDVDADLAQQAFEALPRDSAASRRLVAHFAMRLADTDPEQAIAWAKGLEHEGERAEAFGRIAVVISATDPQKAAALVAAEMPPGTPRDRAVVQVLQRWSQASPADATGWISGFTPGGARSAGLKVTLAAWVVTDGPAAAAWLESRTDDSIRTESLLAVAETLRSGKPEFRASRLGQFQNPEIRYKLENLLAQPQP